MALLPSQRLGPYEILSAIGAGGMGEVYQAHDTKLGRDVAIKVLPEAFAHDPERLSRFQREAKMLASLNHPNIATIYGLEQSNGSQHLAVLRVFVSRQRELTERCAMAALAVYAAALTEFPPRAGTLTGVMA